MNRTVFRPPGSTRNRERRDRSSGRARLVGSSVIVALLLGEPGLADPLPRGSTELGGVLDELESLSEQMEAIASGGQHPRRESALRVLTGFQLRLPGLRRRSRDALSRLDGRIARESGRVERKQRLIAVAVEKLKGLRQSLRAEAAGAATRRRSPREEQVRDLTERLVTGLLRKKERQAATSVATLGDRSRRNRGLDRELAEARTRLESLFRRLETALPSAAALLARAPSVPAAPALLDGGPRRLVRALERIQTALLDVMTTQVAALEAMGSDPASRRARGGKRREPGRPLGREEPPGMRRRLPDASSLRVTEAEPLKRDEPQNPETTKGRNRP